MKQQSPLLTCYYIQVILLFHHLYSISIFNTIKLINQQQQSCIHRNVILLFVSKFNNSCIYQIQTNQDHQNHIQGYQQLYKSYYNRPLAIMNTNFKLRPKLQGPVCISKALKVNKTDIGRRINTEINEERSFLENNIKMTNVFQNRNPLSDNKIINNIEQKKDLKLNYSNSSIKTSNRIKSILVNNEKKIKEPIRPVKTLATEPNQRHKIKISQKLVQKLFQKQKKNTTKELNKTKQSFCKKQPLSGQQKYTYDQIIGSGTFGVVYKGRNKETLQVVAIKKVLQDKKYKNREHEILKILNHPNVLRMKDAFFTLQNTQEYLNVIMDYFPDTVYSLIKKFNKKNIMPSILIKLYSYQMFRSLLYLNKIDICHRDIKPHNILVDTKSNRLVMCDFGSAKKLIKGQPNIAYICSRCYRAPQLIFGATEYTTQIDMWSAGCVLIEMIICQPIFLASNNIDQLVEIIKILGTPTEDQVMAMNPEYDMTQFRFPKINSREWKRVIKQKVDPLLLDLISNIMKYNPNQRYTPFKALCHPYYNDLRNQKNLNMLMSEMQLPNLFDFTGQQCTQSEFDELTPQWSH